ncbi:MAG: YSC84-related protein [Saprospiraceae bacterium]
MKTQLIFCLAFLLAPIFLTAQINGYNPESVKKAEETIESFKAKDSKFETFFEESYAYVVFPKIGKGASFIGGAHGKGIVFEQDEVIGKAKLTQITFGAQFGGQVYSQVIFFETKDDLERFKNGNIELAAQASAVAFKEGATGSLAYSNGVAIFSKSEKGLMYEASVGGQKLKFKSI